MKFNMNISKEQWKNIGNKGYQLGKKIVIKGTQAIVLESTAKLLTTGFDEGLEGIKKLSFDDVVLNGKKKTKMKSKKKLFRDEDDQKVEVEEIKEVKETDEETINISEEQTEIIDK